MPVRERFLPRPGARLQEQFREVARFRHLSWRMEEAYGDWMGRFILFHRRKGAVGLGAGVVALAGEGEGWIWRHPREMGGTKAALRRGGYGLEVISKELAVTEVVMKSCPLCASAKPQ